MRLTPPSSPSISADLRCRLPGGRQGEPYDAVIDAPPGYKVHAAQVPANSGLIVASSNPAHLQGTLRSAAPITVEVVLRNLATQTLQPAQARIHVVAAPGAAYANLPADPNALGAKPEQHSMVARVARWGALGVSIRGRVHANRGTHREDDFRVRALNDSALAFAISDGAGSARLSALASAIAVEQSIAALASLAVHDTGQALANAAQAAAEAIVRAAGQHNALLDEFGCTLILGVYRPPAGDGSDASLALWQVGDGIVMADTHGGIRLLLAGDHGEYAGQTQFLHHLVQAPSQFHSRVQDFNLSGVDWIVACTDGVSDPFSLDLVESADKPFALTDCPPFANMIGTARAVLGQTATVDQLYEAVAVFTPGDHDDRTLVCIAREEAP